ncbi:MAG: urate hydroxylase PuuD [Proteobacteria bacterium]|nr:urate hydroxylase PuuD [Pseudomonadota bacterium]
MSYALDWANLLLRWAHVITAIAWVGASFYFVWLDNSLTPPEDAALRDKGVGGELWAVHGGGFYHPQKYLGAPPRLPAHLHWFYWESYATWLTGFGLFTVLYLFQAGTFLVDKTVHDWSPLAAAGTALGFLAGFWLAYDLICRSLGRRRWLGVSGDAWVGAAVFAVVVAGAWLACQLFAGRAAFLLVGAMIATAMSANVFFWIIPGQRQVVAALRAGQPVDPVHGQRGKQRSVHNTYFVLPVLVAMLSNHHAWLTGAPHNWLVLVLMMLGAALVRQFFVARHKTAVAGRPAPWRWLLAGLLPPLAVLLWLAPTPTTAPPSVAQAGETPAKTAAQLEARAQAIVAQRCVLCHNARLAHKGVRLDAPEAVRTHAQAIYQQAVVLQAMPLNNATQITADERAALGRWFQAGVVAP